jgi:hypothetical protein
MTEQREVIASSVMHEFSKTVPGFSQPDEQFIRSRFAAWRNINPAVRALEVSATDLNDPKYPERIKKLTAEFREWLGGRWKT